MSERTEEFLMDMRTPSNQSNAEKKAQLISLLSSLDAKFFNVISVHSCDRPLTMDEFFGVRLPSVKGYDIKIGQN